MRANAHAPPLPTRRLHDAQERAELVQMECEQKFRECEADMDISELRADILQLREKYEPKELELEREAERIEHSRRPSVQRRTSMTRARRRGCCDFLSWRGEPSLEYAPSPTRPSPTDTTTDNEISFLASLYPCYVLSLQSLRLLARLPVHEDALQAERLDVLTSTSTTPASAFTYFISQNWETFGDAPHPDNARNTKLEWLKNLPAHMKLPPTVLEVWCWWDLICVPQRSATEQGKAIASLCCYAQLCSRFVPLVRDAHAWMRLYGEDITDSKFPTSGAISTYIDRGWCRLEIVAGLTPKKFKSGAWRPGPRNVRFRYHHCPKEAGVGPLVEWNLLRDPMEGEFTVSSDRETCRPVLKLIAQRFAEYAASGSDAWDATLDAHQRPAWLKVLAGVEEGVAESPVVDPILRDAAASPRPFRPQHAGGRLRIHGAGSANATGEDRTESKPEATSVLVEISVSAL